MSPLASWGLLLVLAFGVYFAYALGVAVGAEREHRYHLRMERARRARLEDLARWN